MAEISFPLVLWEAAGWATGPLLEGAVVAGVEPEVALEAAGCVACCADDAGELPVEELEAELLA